MRRVDNNKGFTLVEILAVVALIAILFVVFIPRIDFATMKARETGVQSDFRSYQIAFEQVMKTRAGLIVEKGDDGGAKTCANIRDSLNAYLDNAMKIGTLSAAVSTTNIAVNATIDTGSNKVTNKSSVPEAGAVAFDGEAASKLDPWGQRYKIYGLATNNGTGSGIEVVCVGPDKLEAARVTVGGTAADIGSSIGLGLPSGAPSKLEGETTTSQKYHSFKIASGDDYSLLVTYTPTGITISSDGFDRDINAN